MCGSTFVSVCGGGGVRGGGGMARNGDGGVRVGVGVIVGMGVGVCVCGSGYGVGVGVRVGMRCERVQTHECKVLAVYIGSFQMCKVHFVCFPGRC